MTFTEDAQGLTVCATKDERARLAAKRDIESDVALAAILGVCALMESGLELIKPEEIGALTSAPILARRGKDGEIVDAFGFMDYALRSPLRDLLDTGEVFWQRG